MVPMPCSSSAAMCSGTSRRASRPPCTRGCSVFTRPSSISGKPVISETSVTGRPFSASSLAVPPVDSSFTPLSCSVRAKSTMPVLSETESRAVRDMVRLLGKRNLESESCVSGRSRRRVTGRRACARAACGASVLRLMPSHSAALLWLPSAWRSTTSSSGFSTVLMNISCIECGSTPCRSLKYCSSVSRTQASICFLLMSWLDSLP